MQILMFDAFRSYDGETEDPSSVTVYARIKLAMSDTTNISSAFLMLNYSPTSFEASDFDGHSLDVVTASDLNVIKTLELGDFALEKTWYFILEFQTYHDDPASKSDVVMRSDVPLFIPKNRAGIAFGMYSSATEGYPKMESAYPAYFYGGVEEFGSEWIELTPINGESGAEFGGGLLCCRKIEQKRIITGSVLIQPGSETVVIAELPDVADWAPQTAVFSLNACEGARVARVCVGGIYEENAGKLCLSWVRNLSNGSVYTSAAIWVQCSIEYWVPAGEYG